MLAEELRWKTFLEENEYAKIRPNLLRIRTSTVLQTVRDSISGLLAFTTLNQDDIPAAALARAYVYRMAGQIKIDTFLCATRCM